MGTNIFRRTNLHKCSSDITKRSLSYFIAKPANTVNPPGAEDKKQVSLSHPVIL